MKTPACPAAIVPQPSADFDARVLFEAARGASTKAYAPYSRFHVGAAVLADDGRIFTAANIENASYGLTSCAERNAVFAAVFAGVRAIVAVAIHTPTGEAVSPCGACRQVIYEFGSTATVISCCDGTSERRWSIDELLPGAFGPRDLRDPTA
ncbi:MAG: cytidine deaminase [Burkholderiaceae bacterium]